jgi:digeranylgeranylglycerophospholipid reductase
MYDVIVAGAGPAGSYTARRLAEKGLRVLVLERKARAGEAVCCTGIVGEECARAFDIGERVIIRRVNSATLFSPSGKPLHVERPEPQACILDRGAFDADMAERSQNAGAEYRFGSRVRDIRIREDRADVSVSVRGKESTVQARAVVIAAGFAPALLNRTGLGGFRDFTIGTQTEVPAGGINEVEVYFGGVAPGFFAWLVPTNGPMVRAGLIARQKAGHYLKKWLEKLRARGRISPGGMEIRYGAIPLRPPTRSYGERLLAVGDSAGQVKPTSGGGIYYGLLGAEIAVKVLKRALDDDDLSAKKLSTYQREWHKLLGRELRVGYWSRKLFERLSERHIDRVFDALKSQGIDRTLMEADDLSFDWHSRTILRMLKYRVIARATDLIKLPFGAGEIDR